MPSTNTNSSTTYTNFTGEKRRGMNALIMRQKNAYDLAVMLGLPKNQIETKLKNKPNYAQALQALRSSTSPRRRSSTSPRGRSSIKRSSTSPPRRSSTSRSRSPTHETLVNRINRVVGSKPKLHDNYTMSSNQIRKMLKERINSHTFSDILLRMTNSELNMAANAIRGDSTRNKMKALAKLSGQSPTSMLETHLYGNGGLLRHRGGARRPPQGGHLTAATRGSSFSTRGFASY